MQSGGLNQTLCELTSIQPIQVGWSGGATSANVSALPAGLTSTISGSSLIISGTLLTDETGSSPTTYNYTITSVGGCGTPQTLNGSIIVEPGPNIEITSGNATQDVCIGVAIDPILLSVENTNAANILITGLPPGLVYTAQGSNGGTINGTPSQTVTTTTAYNYVILSTGSSCVEVKLEDSSQQITVIPKGTVTHQSGLIDTDGDNIVDQTPIYCEGNTIDNIVFDILESADDAEVLNLPDGINYVISGGQVTISGTLDVVVDQDLDGDGLVDQLVYSVDIIPTSSGTPCEQVPQSFNFIIAPNPLKNLENTINLEYCNESLVGDINGNNIIDSGELSPIEIQLYSDFVNDGGVDPYVAVTGLPNGLFGLFDTTANKLTIKGKIDESTYGDFNIQLEAFGACNSTVSLGTIKVIEKVDYTVLGGSGEENQTVCFGNAITPINYQLTGILGSTNIQIDWTDNSGTPISPPTGISITSIADIISTGKIDITGTYITPVTTTTVFNYEIQLFEGLCSTYIRGSLTCLLYTSPSPRD